MSDEPIEGTARVRLPESEAEYALAEGGTYPPREPAALTVTPQVTARELVDRLKVIKDAADEAMQEGVDYGVVPGTDKPTLFKPGAEKLAVLFQLDVQLENEQTFDGDHLTVTSRATVYHSPSGQRLGYGEGVCSTKERKYAKRKQDRVCPNCEAAAVIKGKREYGGGWLCWNKRGGCGAKFPDGDQSIEGQEAGEVPNPDLPDLWNTVTKMAEKRARVDAVLAVTGASAIFTQDIEDHAPEPAADARPAEPRRQERRPPSEKQFGFLERLLKRHAGDAPVDMHLLFVRETLSSSEVSALIDRVQSDEKRTDTLARLAVAAAEWQSKQTDLPADDEGLPDPRDTADEPQDLPL